MNSNVNSSNLLYCDGSTFDQNDYPELYTVLGDSNVLPDLRGRVLKNISTTSPNLGTLESGSVLNHTHSAGGLFTDTHGGH